MNKRTFLNTLMFGAIIFSCFAFTSVKAYSTITPVNRTALAHYKANIIKHGDPLQEFNLGFYDDPSITGSTKQSLTITMAEEQRQAILHELQKQNALLKVIANELAGKGK